MKLKIIFFYLLSLFASNLLSFELISELNLENRQNIDYEKLQEIFDNGYKIVSEYDSKSNNLFILLPTFIELPPDKTTNILKSSSEKEKEKIMQLSVFSKDGKFIKKIGQHGSHAQDGFLSLKGLNLIKNELQLVGNKLIAFDKNNFTFKYYIDPTCPQEPVMKLLVNLCKKDKCFGEQPFGFLTEHFNNVFTAKLKDDPEYPEVKLIYETKHFLDIKKYKDAILGNCKKYNKIDESIMVRSYVGVIWTECIYISANFALQNDNSYFVINGFGTELFHYDEFDVIQDSIYLEQINEIRRIEIDNFLRTHEPSTKFKYFSHLENFFINEKNKKSFLFFSASEIIKEKFGSSKLLSVYSTKTKKPILDITPIDFYPITYDENNDLLVGIKVFNQNIKLQFYRL